MSIKRILVPLPSTSKHVEEIMMALEAAKTLGAHVEAQFIHDAAPGGARQGMYSGRMGAGAVSAAVAAAAPGASKAEEVHKVFQQACKAAGVNFSDGSNGKSQPKTPSASWSEEDGDAVSVVEERAAGFDLIVAASSAVADKLREIAEASLLKAHRPVLLSPLQRPDRLGGRAMIAWDESPACWHAVTAAVPFLKKADRVHVVSVGTARGARLDTQDDLLNYLRCHGISADTRTVEARSGQIGDSILATANEDEAELLVMGAYSRGALREMLLGGATRHVLRSVATTPVLMAH